MEAIISGRNAKILAQDEATPRSCSCSRNATCPLDGKCLSKNIIYHASVVQADKTTRNYIGLTSTDFKARLAVHNQSFKNEEINQTSLSKHILDLKTQKMDYTVGWTLVDRAKPFSPVSNVCALCIRENFYIMFRPTLADLNSRSEIYSNCRHKQAALLVRKERKKKTRPG
jgi:hypothetical protein